MKKVKHFLFSIIHSFARLSCHKIVFLFGYENWWKKWERTILSDDHKNRLFIITERNANRISKKKNKKKSKPSPSSSFDESQPTEMICMIERRNNYLKPLSLSLTLNPPFWNTIKSRICFFKSSSSFHCVFTHFFLLIW